MSDDTKRPADEAEREEQDDTEGHSLATYEYGRLVSRERAQDAERQAREARMRRTGDKRG